MIDLRFDFLPNSIECDGHLYALDTSFRKWIEFGEMVENRIPFVGIFANEIPEGDWFDAAYEFYESPTVCPHGISSPSVRTIDLIEDGELIVAAFQQAYGIDLTECDMHWHRFRALLAGIPDDTKLSKVMSYRSYKTPSRSDSYDADMRKMRQAWSLPEREDTEGKRELLEWAESALPW